ncbi:MAG: ABC transporter permease subunit [Actinobacteria bacterium]|nr:ABC transporter permease subunit [Actinomycetota bacterium]
MNHIRREFVKILFQKRTYFGWAGLFLIPWLITIAMRLSNEGPPPPGQGGPEFVFLITSNGLYVALASLFALISFLLPLLASMSGSQTIAGEAENGTLRTVLMQPVRRGALLTAKWFVANLYIAIGLVILLVSALVAGGAFFGFDRMTLFTGETVGVGHGIGLICVAYLFSFVAMATVVSLAVTFSTLTNSGLTAVAAALVLVIVMLVLGGFSVFDFLEPYLFTSHFDAWTNFFQSPVDWGPITDALINFAVWIVGLTVIAWLIFRRKDILS